MSLTGKAIKTKSPHDNGHVYPHNRRSKKPQGKKKPRMEKFEKSWKTEYIILLLEGIVKRVSLSYSVSGRRTVFWDPVYKQTNKQGGGTQTSSGNGSQHRLRGAHTARFFTQPPFVPHSIPRTGRSVRKAKQMVSLHLKPVTLSGKNAIKQSRCCGMSPRGPLQPQKTWWMLLLKFILKAWKIGHNIY